MIDRTVCGNLTLNCFSKLSLLFDSLYCSSLFHFLKSLLLYDKCGI